MASNTDKTSILVTYQVGLIKASALALGIPDLPGATVPGGDPSVFFGDQTLIPVTPTICVAPGPRDRDIGHTKAGFRSINTFTVFFMIYHGKVQDAQTNELQCLQYAESVEALLHQNKQMSGYVYNGWVERLDPGIAMRGGTLMRATRLTWIGNSETQY